jgi:hypothetical protein
MKSNFEERKANRLDAYHSLAAKAESESNSAFNTAHSLGSVIPMGQPILVGHHSEKRHRNHLKKMDNAMRRSVEADEKQKYYMGRAESLLNSTAISSDDPNAIDKLTEKLERLEGLQELMKDCNAIIRSRRNATDKVTELMALGMKEGTAVKLLDTANFGGPGFPRFSLTNNGATIRATKERIEYLTKMAAIGDQEEDINGVRYVVNQADNRVQLFFPGKPSDEVRAKLKGAGFRWAPSVGAWMRQISNGAIYSAKNILNGLS